GSFVGGRIEKGVQADALTHTYDIRINVTNTERQLLPGMVASVQFKASPSPSQSGNVLIPVTSIQKKTDGSLFVWTIGNDSTAHRTTVTIGETTGNRVTVSTGLENRQRIVTEGYQKLSEGTKVVF
ncbi:MAG: efflux RND transporter periplasmic adaptor subunit, partial [Prevotella sp.]|nr:efflux RND transporter periplasmic adaptor subunit [Prevotella sp.]